MRHFREFYKKFTRRVLLLPAFAGIVCVALRLYLGPYISLVVLSLAMIMLFVVIDKKGRGLMSFVLTAFFVAFILLYFYIFSSVEMPVLNHDVSFNCKVISVSHSLDGSYKLRVYSSLYGYLEFKLTENEDIPLTGDEITLSGIFYEPDSPRNPGQFDYKSYLKRRGVDYAFMPETIEKHSQSTFLRTSLRNTEEMMYRFRQRILSLYDDNAPLAASVFLGDGSLIDTASKSLYKRNGCAHLLAVSGTHFAGFLSVFAFFLNIISKPKFRAALSVFLCILLASFTGWSSSVTRACIMCCATNCSRDPLSGLSTACILMILTNPYSALSYGFLMTTSASLALLYLTPCYADFLERHLPKKAANLLAPVLSAQTGMLPFIMLTSQKFGIVPLLLQIVSSFIAAVACSFFVPCVILSLLFSPVFATPSSLLLMFLNYLITIADKYYSGISIPFDIAMIIFVLLFVTSFKVSSISRKFRIPLFVLLLALVMSNILSALFVADAKIVFIDVGQGDSCLVMCGNKTVLIDGGTYEAGEESVLCVLDYYDIRHVDIAIATHWDMDHIGGLLYLYQNGIIDQIYTSYIGKGPKQQEIMDEFMPDESIEEVFSLLEAGDSISLSDSFVVDVLYPLSRNTYDGGNDDSLVLLLKCNETNLLLTGDLAEDGEIDMLSDMSIGKVDILKAGHHGSGYSTGYALLSDTRPDIAVISAGINNIYGHPSEETLKRLRESDADIISTLDIGAITIEIYDDRYKIYGFVN